MRIGVRGKLGFRVATVVVAGLLISSEGDAVMLEWMGKKKVVNHHNEVPFHVLERKWSFGMPAALTQRTQSSQSDAKNFEPHDENMVIHGDNLLALKSLLPRYEGKVKCIYIDPPYNTGNEGWCYNDNVNDPQMKAWLGKVVGKEGEDFSRHDKWLCMMYPRLKLLQKLLADDGAIFISIDDNELFNLKPICDEVFGLGNFISNFIWYNTGHTDKQEDITNVHEYILCYAKKRNALRMNAVVDPATKSDSKILNEFAENSITKNGRKNPPSEISLPKGFPCEVEALNKPKHANYQALVNESKDHGYITREMTSRLEITYPARHDDMVVSGYALQAECKVYSGWMNNSKLKAFIKCGFKPLEDNGTSLRFYLSKNGVIYYRREGRQSHYVQTVLQDQGTTEKTKYILENMGVRFDYPKPVELVGYLFSLYSDKDSIILDSFAGSGTTAHAVLKANAADGGNRKFILIEMMDYAESVTAERVKRVIAGYGAGDRKVEGTGGSFGYYELGPELMKEGVINEEAGEEAIREYVWYTETKGSGVFNSDSSDATLTLRETFKKRNVSGASEKSELNKTADTRYLLGTAFGVAYYFCYEKGAVVTLNRSLLKKIKTKAESYVIYADICTLSAAELEKYRITFKKIPRDITRF